MCSAMGRSFRARCFILACFIWWRVLASRNFYNMLEVPEDATPGDIKKAYRRLALMWHPDKSQEKEAAERFRELAEAYEVLGDPHRRKQYDARSGPESQEFVFRDADDIFKEFFGDEDPFKMFDKAFEHVETSSARASSEAGGFFSMVSSFFSSFSGSSKTPAPSKTIQESSQSDAEATSTCASGSCDASRGAVASEDAPSSGSPVESQGGAVASEDAPSSGSPVESQGGDECTAEIREDAEPLDTTVKHTTGSACCNPSPEPSATDRLGCCRRCQQSEDCEVFVWQPSGGSCWLLRWQDSEQPVVAASDRVMGKLPKAKQ